jgi:hypothetical protein
MHQPPILWAMSGGRSDLTSAVFPKTEKSIFTAQRLLTPFHLLTSTKKYTVKNFIIK